MKKLLLSILLISIVGFAFADKVDLDKASKVAVNAYYDRVNNYLETVDLSNIIIEEQFSFYHNGEEAYYIFNMKDYGFIIIAAEDAMTPVLGYGFTKQYDPKNVPTNFQGLMNGQVEAVEYCRINDIEADNEVMALWSTYLTPEYMKGDREEVGPLTPSTWNQDYPYNYYCPEDAGGSGGHVYAGCVATTMAQVMYYWRHPWVGVGGSSYYHPSYGTLQANHQDAYYDYNAMVDNVSGSVNLAVALLQYHCGVAVNMNYGPDGSGANMTQSRNAMTQHFKFKTMAQRVTRQQYSLSDWKDMCRADIDLGRPIMYAGFDNSGGHAWVLDGYNDNDEFHFNFGWGGYSDGYYPITNPAGFTQDQEMVYHLEPIDDEYPHFCNDITISTFNGIISDESGPMADYENNASCQWLFDLTDGNYAPGSTMTFDVLNMDTEAEADIITIYDGPSTSSPVLAEISGDEITSVETSEGLEAVLVTFESNGSGSGEGFRIEYDVDVSCGETYPYRAYVFDDGSGEYNYYPNGNCSYMIEPEGATYVNIDFTEFDIDEGDVVKVHDGVTYQVLGEFSGTMDPPPTGIECPNNKVWVLFESDEEFVGPGWTISYTSDGTLSDVNEQEIFESFEMYPNPANSMLNLKFNALNAQDFEISIINLQGQEVYSDQVNNFSGYYNNSVNISEYSKGVYFVNFKTENAVENRRLLIQ